MEHQSAPGLGRKRVGVRTADPEIDRKFMTIGIDYHLGLPIEQHGMPGRLPFLLFSI